MTRQMDFTVECWACWFDAAAGGEAPQGTVGNVLWHYANNVMVRINSTGFGNLIMPVVEELPLQSTKHIHLMY